MPEASQKWEPAFPVVGTRPKLSLDRRSERRRRDTYQSGDAGTEPETLDDLRFCPAGKLEVVVDWAHFEDPLASGDLKVTDLDNYREDLDNQQSPDQRKQNKPSRHAGD